MRFSHLFIDRPILAGVISILLTLVGAISFRALPIAEYPDIAPPTIVVNATFAGASAEVVAQAVAEPIEQEINGVESMIYIVSQSTGNGELAINVVFKPGTNIDQAQVLVQNRVSIALPRLPEEVRRIGVTVRKSSPDLMQVIYLISPDGSLDQQYISNYATINIRDVINRIDGVGDTVLWGARDYSMRVWLDPAKVQSRGLTASDVVLALRAANVQVAAGAINQPPATSPGGFEVAVQTLGRLTSPDQFSDIVVATDQDGRVTRVRDIARVELGSQSYTSNAYLGNKVATAIGVFQRPGVERSCYRGERAQHHAGPSQEFPGRDELRYRLRHDCVRSAIGQRGVHDNLGGRDPGRDRRRPLPAVLAGRDHPDSSDSGVAGRHVFYHGSVRLLD
jgi:multidrug efflux pump subunit AcrB